jgi:hypothetical protein
MWAVAVDLKPSIGRARPCIDVAACRSILVIDAETGGKIGVQLASLPEFFEGQHPPASSAIRRKASTGGAAVKSGR